eukprot:6177181-Amphidinium_carterae.2
MKSCRVSEACDTKVFVNTASARECEYRSLDCHGAPVESSAICHLLTSTWNYSSFWPCAARQRLGEWRHSCCWGLLPSTHRRSSIPPDPSLRSPYLGVTKSLGHLNRNSGDESREQTAFSFKTWNRLCWCSLWPDLAARNSSCRSPHCRSGQLEPQSGYHRHRKLEKAPSLIAVLCHQEPMGKVFLIFLALEGLGETVYQLLGDSWKTPMQSRNPDQKRKVFESTLLFQSSKHFVQFDHKSRHVLLLRFCVVD